MVISKSGNREQYYYKVHPSDKKKRYLRAKEEKIIGSLCRKDYHQKVLASAQRELKELERLKKNYPCITYEDVYGRLHAQRQKYIQPIWLPDEEYILVWRQEEYQQKSFSEDAPEYYTDRGERVRSKTEILIANALNKHGVPYKYEKPLLLEGYGRIHPDFTVLNVRTRKEFYWEHMGMMDNSSYAEEALQRLAMYEKNDIFPGEQLILTHETQRNPIHSKTIEKMIVHYLI